MNCYNHVMICFYAVAYVKRGALPLHVKLREKKKGITIIQHQSMLICKLCLTLINQYNRIKIFYMMFIRILINHFVEI